MMKTYLLKLAYADKLINPVVITALKNAIAPLPIKLVQMPHNRQQPSTNNYLQVYFAPGVLTESWYCAMAEALLITLGKCFLHTPESRRQRMTFTVNIENKDTRLTCELNTRLTPDNFEESLVKLFTQLPAQKRVKRNEYYDFDRQKKQWHIATHEDWMDNDPVAVKHTIDDFNAALTHIENNKKELAESDGCFCIYCCQTYRASAIKQWISEAYGNTAKCIKCNNPAVIGSASGLPLADAQFRHDMNIYFEGYPVVVMVEEEG